MRKFLMPLVAAAFAASALSAFADDPVKAGGPNDKPGRAADEQKTDKKSSTPLLDKPGRAVDEAGTKPKKHSKKKMKKDAAPAAAATETK